MIPPEYIVFFTTMAGVGATLFGLIFVAISIVPESSGRSASLLERQVKAITAYTALLNPLIISLFALVPHQEIGTIILVMALIGLVNTLTLVVTMVRKYVQWIIKLRHSLFILASFFLYGYETYFGVRLLQTPSDVVSLYVISDILIFISFFGIIRAWDLVGISRFRVLDWLSPAEPSDRKDNSTDIKSTHPVSTVKKGKK